MSHHRDREFSTPDRDNDVNYYYHCGDYYDAGWWYGECYSANLNGVNGGSNDYGVALFNRDTYIFQYDLQYTQMKIRPV